MKEVTIIGGGFAGLSAAVRLCKAGVPVRLLERRQTLGGRAFSFTDAVTQDTVDNGQHLFMKCYWATLDFLKHIGAHDDVVFQPNFQIDFRRPKQDPFKLSFPSFLPSPLNLLVGFLKFGAIHWTDVVPLGYLKRELKKELAANLSVDQWLDRCKQKPRMREAFWDPLCLAALNEKPQNASAQHLQTVLREAFFGQSDGALLGYSQKGLSGLFVDRAEDFITRHGGTIEYGVAIESIDATTKTLGLVLRSGIQYQTETCIAAIPPPALAKLISAQIFPDLHRTLHHYIPSPILSINLWFDRPIMQEPLCGLIGTKMEWVFNKSALYQKHDRASPGQVTLVASAARELVKCSDQDLITLAISELNQTYPDSQSASLRHAKVIREHTATFTLPLKHRAPSTQTAHANLLLAGDWTNTGLPATIESAVRSGYAAADAILSK